MKGDAHSLTRGEPALVPFPPILTRSPVVMEMGVDIDQHSYFTPDPVD